MKNLKTFNIIEYLSDIHDIATQEKWSFYDVILEITSSGLDNNQIALCLKEIVHNDTWTIKK